ncbi:hypothetical protein AMAG_15140 [Allomyces macrogynus ATCC 38327]|uniref:Uncharacterized protein n=1 Tax=Allomyces macrogynus (strain ATCC 38327) TaxID=578462 RepID=A0A0L0T6J2_ALLM3|nr:hypothetical protein AMAG_15140 [Allomyces macrogynus ATCC 38327]|eukprot:KNE70169.1 hypothetical protein AMAG_15140 [Allomyces macrogynus ATCC 38327]
MRILRQPRPLPSADATTDPLDLWLADPLAASRAFARAKLPAALVPPTCLATSPLESSATAVAAPILLSAQPWPAPPRATPAALPEPLPTIPVSLPVPTAAAACAPLPAWPACEDHGLMVAPVPWLTAHLPICSSWPVAAAAAEHVDRDAMDVDDDSDDSAAWEDEHRCARVRLPTPPPLHVASRAPRRATADGKDVPGRRRRMRVPLTAPSTP